MKSVGMNPNNGSLYKALSGIQKSMLNIQIQMDTTVRNINNLLKNVQVELNFEPSNPEQGQPEIPLDKIDVVDDIESDECEVVGEIVDLIYVGDHYRYILRTENEEDFVFVSTYSYNLNDTIGLKVKKEDIKLRLKKEVTEYEI